MNGDVLAFFRPDAATVICSSGANQCNELRIPVIVRDFHFMGSFVRISVELKEHAGDRSRHSTGLRGLFGYWG